MISSQSKIRRNPQVVARELAGDEGAVLLHLVSGRYHGVNLVGLLIWEALENERSLVEIVEAVRAGLTEVPEELEDDVVDFVSAAKERDLVVVE